MNLMEDYFWSICLEENLIQAAIWNIENNAANVIAFSKPVNYEDDEGLVQAADECLSGCVQSLPEEIKEPSKTVFGVPSFWVSAGQIERKYLDKIRLLCNKLSLTPTGFVVLPEAIAHFQKSQEHTPITGIVIGVYKQSIDVSLFRLGNLEGTVNVARSVKIADDVVEGLARFDSRDAFPSQFLLYDAHEQDLEDVKQELIKADWNNLDPKIKFLHTPSAEILPSDSKMAAVSLAGAAEIANLTKVNFKNGKEKPEQSHPTMHKTDFTDNIEGFVEPESLGFSASENPEPLIDSRVKNHLPLKSFKFPTSKLLFFKHMKFKANENSLFFGSVGLLSLIIIGLVLFWFLPRADVNIIISPLKIEEEKQVKFDSKTDKLDISKLIIPAKVISTSLTTDKTKPTTGTKVIGSPAKGSVTFYNVGGETTIPKGTVLKSSNLEFSLDSDVQIASASGAASSSTSKGNITALGVGGDYNLGGDSVFSVGNFSQSLIQAKNSESLSGGSSQEVTAVSKDDISSLTASLMEELEESGKNKLKENLSAGDLFIETSVASSKTSASSDKKEGEEATSVKVSVTAKVSGLTVSRSDMNALVREQFKDKIKPGYSLKEDQIDFIFKENSIEFKINLLPTIDTDKIANQIAGKNEATARGILNQIAGYDDAEFVITPNIFQILPHVPKNISVTLEAK